MLVFCKLVPIEIVWLSEGFVIVFSDVSMLVMGGFVVITSSNIALSDELARNNQFLPSNNELEKSSRSKSPVSVAAIQD